ncbi:MAG: hypothetical protein Q4G04_00565 [bacterium]|nr:hypothetical protein [bacterium]
MNFSKLNLEFNKMQITIDKYNNQCLQINNKIKSNQKDIIKYEKLIKNSSQIEKILYKSLKEILIQENGFLKTLIEEDISNEKGTV